MSTLELERENNSMLNYFWITSFIIHIKFLPILLVFVKLVASTWWIQWENKLESLCVQSVWVFTKFIYVKNYLAEKVVSKVLTMCVQLLENQAAWQKLLELPLSVYFINFSAFLVILLDCGQWNVLLLLMSKDLQVLHHLASEKI